MYLSRRHFNIALASLASSLCLPQVASASTVIALSLEELVAQSRRASLCTPVDHYSDWVEMGNSRRIVTLTRLVQHEDWLQDDAQEDEIEVLTLGGRVGDIGQKVPGEAILQLGEDSLLFVGQEAPMARRVIGMAQGQYPVEGSGKQRVLKQSLVLPHLVDKKKITSGLAPRPRAVKILPSLSLDEARSLVRNAR